VDSLANDIEKKAAIVRTLAALYPWMKPFYPRPLRDYASRLYAAPATTPSPECRTMALHKLLAAMKKAAIRAGLPAETAADICRDFNERRVLQTGPHLLLLLEPEAFYTHAFSLLGLSAHDCSSYVSYAVSTMSLVERARKGPGWLTVDGKTINVFGLSRSRMIGYSLLTGNGPYRFELASMDDGEQGDALLYLRSLLPEAQFERPAQAIKTANVSLWPRLFGDRFTFLQLDDEDGADLVADHLSERSSWLRRQLVESPKMASSILEIMDHLAVGPWAGWFTRGTDFFWAYENGKRLPLRLLGRDLVHQDTGARVVPFEPAELVEKLLNRSLVPNMFLAFLVLAILPGVRVLGGSHQPIYYPLMRYVVVRAIDVLGVDAELRKAMELDDLPGAWGHRVLDDSTSPGELLGHGGSRKRDALIGKCGDLALIDACGAMNSFTQDEAWSKLATQLDRGVVSATDPEWALA
jgi:hypothetical protein